MPSLCSVSAIVPCFNRKLYASEAVESLLNQSHPLSEILVVDDGSTDGTPEHLRSRFGSNIHIIEKRNTGPGASRNLGVEQSSGAFLCFLDDDDVAVETRVENQLRIAMGDPSCGIVGGSVSYIDESGRDLEGISIAPESVTHEEASIRARIPGIGSNVLVRRSAFESVGGFDVTLRRAQDLDFVRRVSRCWRVRNTTAVTTKVRFHSGVRVNVNYDVILECRNRIIEQIEDPIVRRKARAWLHYSLYLRYGASRGRAAMLLELFRSFVAYPGTIDDDAKRLRPLVSELLGRGAIVPEGLGGSHLDRKRPDNDVS